MELLNKIREHVQGLDEKEFFKYLLIALSCLVLIISLFVFRYYRKIGNLRWRLVEINNQRQEVRKILTKAEIVKKHRKTVDAILDQDPSFKIIGYFEKVLEKLNLKAKIDTLEKDVSERYMETELVAKVYDTNMESLCRLLDEFGKEKRINAKAVEIEQSTRQPKSINITITIATLQPKVETMAPGALE